MVTHRENIIEREFQMDAKKLSIIEYFVIMWPGVTQRIGGNMPGTFQHTYHSGRGVAK